MKTRPVTLETADLLAIAGIVLPLLLAVMGGTLAWLKSDIRDLRAETRAVNTRVDVLTQAILASALVRNPPTGPSETAAPSPATGTQSTPAG